LNAPICFVDTETTGVHPGRRAWEVVIIRREPNGAETTLHAFVGDVDLSAADPYGLRVGRFYDRHPLYATGPRPDDALLLSEQRVARLVEEHTRGAHLVGAVPNFDAEVFADMLRRHRLAPAWHYHLVDVENLAVGYLAAKLSRTDVSDQARAELGDMVMPPWSSEELSRMCGVDPAGEDERHTALGDAKWAMRLYDAIVTAAQGVVVDA
jgi:hypothetical protein